MKNPTTEKKIQDITRIIVEKFQPEKVILFGSYAWGVPGPESDVDLLIIKESRRRKIDRARELRASLFGHNFPPMDLLIYTPSELDDSINRQRNLFLEDIIRHGVILFSQETSTIPLYHKLADIIL